MSLEAAALSALALIALLFAVAALVEVRGGRLLSGALGRRGLRHTTYTLALGVYCTSWTFYGSVGSAVRDGWSYLPIYLAPVLLLLLAPRFLGKLARAVAEERATTVSDFIAARFRHDVIVARLVTVIALLGTIPYVALQFRSIGNALSIVSGRAVQVPVVIGAAALLALFAILFGARRYEQAARSEGLLYAIGLESLIKLAALLAVAGMAVAMLWQVPAATLAQGAGLLAERFSPQHLSLEVGVIGLISAMAIIVLPRQFFMGVVEAQDPDDLVRARFGLAAYVAVMAAVIIPIALAGMTLLSDHAKPDLFVLELPRAAGNGWIVMAAMLGGIAAAASMVIVDSTALAAMVSNDLFFPSVLRSGAGEREGGIGQRMLMVRRASIVGIMMLALAWALLLPARESLASIGLVAFAAMAQFTPHLILATSAGGRDPLPARASLAVGLAFWAYTLALPPVLPDVLRSLLAATPLDPLRLFGIGRASPLVHGVAWSLGANLAVYAAVAARGVRGSSLPRLVRSGRSVTNLAELVDLTAGFVGRERAEREFPGAAQGLPVDRKAASRARALIGGVVGVSSARALVASALADGQMNLADVTRLLDEGGQSLRFSRQLLAATFENIDAGISVVDAELNLVAWNNRYEEVFDYPPGMVRVGAPIADLIRHNALRGDFGPGDIDVHVEKRLSHLRRGLEHSFERRRPDGRFLKTVGGPMPGGGYVMSFTDITEEARMRDELRRTLETLEQRVTDRTREVSEANRRLAEADRDKTRFLAAASHDLLQPLHAARLFTAALERDVPGHALPLVSRVESSILAAEDLLRALLDISKLDAGGVHPSPEPVALAPFLSGLIESFRPTADAQGLRLLAGPLWGQVCTDPGLLRSVIQNFLANALRYTEQGGVIVGVRQRQDMLRIDVVDSGVGIEPDKIDSVFGEFTRLGQVEVEGLGLGLALAERIVRLLGGRIDVRSQPGRGSRFSLLLPAMETAPLPLDEMGTAATREGGGALCVLVVDNDLRIVEASVALLTRLGHRALGVADMDGALAHVGEIDAVLADYRLDHGEDGLTLIEQLHALRPGLPAALITAESDPEIRRRAAVMGVEVHAKPVSPVAIEDFLTRASVLQIQP